VVARLRTRWRAANARSQAFLEQLFGGVDDLVRNVDLWRSYGAGERISHAIDVTSRQAVRAAARVDGARAALSGANELLAALALLGAVLLAVRLGIPLGDGTLVAFAVVFFMAYRPLRDLGDGRAWCARGAAAMAGLGQLVGSDALEASSTAPARREPRGGVRRTANSIVHSDNIVAGQLRVEALGARDRGPRTSFTLEPGELIAVVGDTGSGKSTLLRVLLGLEPATGRVWYGTRDITEAAVGPSARPFAWVPQDAPLVTGTLLCNVALHAPSEAAAKTALEQIGAERLLRYQSDLIGPGGRPLSGGERRQVALARALASGAPVLLVDEPTAGLDFGSTQRVLDALQRLRCKRSMIVVTHRRQVIAIADRVVPIGSHS
jgi:ATP-binding cassette subfamily C protein CydD